MYGLTQNFKIWLFGLDRWKKRLLQITFDGLATPVALLLAFFMRLETTDYLYRLDTYIGVSIATLAILAVFTGRGLYNNLTRHISMETAYTITVGSAASCAVLLSGTLLLELEAPRFSTIDLCNACMRVCHCYALFHSWPWPKRS